MTRTKFKLLPLLGVAILLALGLSSHVFAQSGVNYIYDELGRLVGVIDPTGNAAAYNYDAVGNLLSINRYTSTQASIIQFTPKSGPIGTPVTISGTGFSTTLSQNTVRFNGTVATITSATVNQIVTSVPSLAITGPISITSPAGSFTTTAVFTVTAGTSGAPTITGFTPTIGTSGTPVTLNGTNFDAAYPNNRIRFNPTQPAPVNSGTTSTLATSVPTSATTGHINLSTPNGTTTSSGFFFVPPFPRVAADVGFTGSIALGQSQTINTLGANQIGLLAFDATAGQQISILATNVTNTGKMTLFAPSGSSMAVAGNFVSSDGFIDLQTLPVTGTYTIMLESIGSPGVIATLTLYDARPVTATVTPGGAAIRLSLSVPGQAVQLSFNGTAGRQVSFQISNETVLRFPQGSCCSTAVTFSKPDGSQLSSSSFSGTSGTYVDSQTLPATGTYTITIKPPGSPLTFSADYTLFDCTDIVSAITPTVSGTAVAPATTVPGQSVRYTFSGNAGDRLSINIPSHNVAQADISILKPDGSILATASVGTAIGISARFIDAQTLPLPGTYTVRFHPVPTNTGSANLTIYSVPPDVTGSITLGGPSVPATIASPGQRVTLTFNVTAAQVAAGLKVNLQMASGGTIGNANITLKNPGGTVVASTSVGTSGGFLNVQTLTTAGTYSIVIDGVTFNTGYSGTVNLTLYDASDQIGTITANGTQAAVSTTIPGQVVRLNFNGTANQRVSLQFNNLTYPACGTMRVQIANAGGTELAGLGTCIASNWGFIEPIVLATTGQYSVIVTPQGSNYTGSMNLWLYTVPPDSTGTITVNGPAVPVSINPPGLNARLTFSVTASQQITVRVTNNTITGGVTVSLLNGTTTITSMFTNQAAFNLTTQTLAPGTYTVFIQHNSFYTGTLNVSVTSP